MLRVLFKGHRLEYTQEVELVTQSLRQFHLCPITWWKDYVSIFYHVDNCKDFNKWLKDGSWVARYGWNCLWSGDLPSGDFPSGEHSYSNHFPRLMIIINIDNILGYYSGK